MAPFDNQWFTGWETALTGLGTAVAGAGAAFIALRKGWFSDSAMIDLLKTLQAERDLAKTERDAAIKVAKDAQNLRYEDAVTIATLEADSHACQERAAKCEDHARECQQRVRDTEERLVKQSEKLLTARMRATLFYEELAKRDLAAAERLGKWEPEKTGEASS